MKSRKLLILSFKCLTWLEGRRKDEVTIEGAIKRFESLIVMAEDRIRDFESCWPSWKSGFRKDKELYEMAVASLRAQQTPAKLDRSQWDGCEWCGNLEERPCHACSIKYDHWRCGEGHPNFKMLPYKYCPECGKPLTEQSWLKLESKIGGVK